MSDLKDPGSRGFTVSAGNATHDVFVVRKGDLVAAYLNRCPHTGAPLDWTENQFLSLDGKHIQCAMHAALFEIKDGVCVAGPCVGDRLTPIAVTIEEDEVVVRPGGLLSINT